MAEAVVSADEGAVVDTDITDSLRSTFGIEATPAPAQEEPAPGTPAAPAEATPTAPSTPESTVVEEKPEPTPAEQMKEMLDAAGGEAMKLDPEKVPETLRPFLKSFQADFTRKTQALAEQRKQSAEELAADEVGRLRAEIEALKTAQPAPVYAPAPQQKAPEPIDARAQIVAGIEAELGKMLTYEEALASDNPAHLQTYITQQNRLEARLAQAEMLAVISPRLQAQQSAMETDKYAAAQAQWQAVVADKPALAEYEGEVAALLNVQNPDGSWKFSLEQATDFIMGRITREDDVSHALALGIEAGKQQATQVAKNKDNFSVPSSSTGSKGGPAFTKDMSLEDIGLAAVADL